MKRKNEERGRQTDREKEREYVRDRERMNK